MAKDPSNNNRGPLYDINLEDVKRSWLLPALDHINTELAHLNIEYLSDDPDAQLKLDLTIDMKKYYESLLNLIDGIGYTEDMIKRGKLGMTRHMISGRTALIVAHAIMSVEDPVTLAEFLLAMLAEGKHNTKMMQDLVSFADFHHRQERGEIPSITNMLKKIRDIEPRAFDQLSKIKDGCTDKNQECEQCEFNDFCLALNDLKLNRDPRSNDPNEPINGQGEAIVDALCGEDNKK